MYENIFYEFIYELIYEFIYTNTQNMNSYMNSYTNKPNMAIRVFKISVGYILSNPGIYYI